MSELNKQYFETRRIHKKGFKKWGWVLWGVIFIIAAYQVYNSIQEQLSVKEPFLLSSDQFDFSNQLNNGDTLQIIANVSVCATLRVEKDVITKENGKVYIQSEAGGFIVDEWHEVLPKREYKYNLSDSLNFENLFRYVADKGTNSIYAKTFKIIYRDDTVHYYSNGLGEQVPNSEYYLNIKRRLYPKQKIYEPIEDVPLPPTPPVDSNSISEQIAYDTHKSKDSFDEFLQQFNTDSLFQIRHIHFPFEVQSMDFEDNIETSLIMTQQWKHLDLNYDSAYAKREIDAYERDIKCYKDSSIVSLRGIDNGIGMDYIFEKEGSDWVLTKFIDYSN